MIKRACEIKKELAVGPTQTLVVCYHNIVGGGGIAPSVIEKQLSTMEANCKAAGLDGNALVSNMKDWEKLKAGKQCG
jgi:hypothetical protein